MSGTRLIVYDSTLAVPPFGKSRRLRAQCSRHYRGELMGKKCVGLDVRINHHRLLASRITDEQTLDGIKGLIAGMEAEKSALHLALPSDHPTAANRHNGQ